MPVSSTIEAPGGRQYVKTEWFFRSGEAPTDYEAVLHKCASNNTGLDASQDACNIDTVIAAVLNGLVGSVENSTAAQERATMASQGTCMLPVGVTTYNEVFATEEVTSIEGCSDTMDTAAREGKLPAECFHTTQGKGGGLKRTKFFFGARYLWTREQLSGPDAGVAMGVRADVPDVPKWMQSLVEAPLVDAEIIPQGFIDSIALNMYHDGSEGIQSHFDDAQRFNQPIYSLRLFSDSRMSFGTQLYGYTNGAFCIPMPRGCVTVMEAGGYAANGVKHCIRPVDMAGKSAGMILRRINPAAMERAKTFVVEECMEWMRCLSLEHSLRSVASMGLPQQGRPHAGQFFDRQRSVGVKVGKMVTRVMESMLDKVEQRVANEARKRHRDRVATALLLAGMLRKVEAAERAGVELSSPEAAAIFAVLDDVVSFCEHPSALSSKQPMKSQTGKRPRQDAGAKHSPLVCASNARHIEQQTVCQVLGGIVMATEAGAAWEAQGQKGPRPTYAAAASLLDGTAPAAQLMQLAQRVAAAVLLPMAPVAGGDAAQLEVAVHAAAVACKVQSKAQLRQVLLTAIGASAAGQQTPLSVAQFQAAVAMVYRALCAPRK